MAEAARQLPPPDLYDPRLVLTGVSFRTLDIEWREKLAQRAPKPEQLAHQIVQKGLAKEAAVISTCNRFEILSVGGDGGGIRGFFESLIDSPITQPDTLYQYLDAKAVRHLYRVSSSLDSMVVGEAQILGQVKRAYQQAVEVGSIGSHLHHLFQSAFHVAKKVRAHTDIAQHGVSLSYVAVKLAQQIFSDLGAVSVLVIGSGEMAELSALHLCSHGCQKIVVANRTVERAAELAARFGGLAVSLGDVDRVLDQVDIVIGSISIDRPLLTRASLRSRRGDRPLFLIDLGVPRNFSSELSDLDNVYLYNIDDLATIASDNKALRDAAAKDAEIVIEYGLMQFERWRAKLAVQPDIIDLRASIQRICATELEQNLRHIEGISPDVVAHLAYAISQKVGHELTGLVERQRGVSPTEHDDPPFVLLPTKAQRG